MPLQIEAPQIHFSLPEILSNLSPKPKKKCSQHLSILSLISPNLSKFFYSKGHHYHISSILRQLHLSVLPIRNCCTSSQSVLKPSQHEQRGPNLWWDSFEQIEIKYNVSNVTDKAKYHICSNLWLHIIWHGQIHLMQHKMSHNKDQRTNLIIDNPPSLNFQRRVISQLSYGAIRTRKAIWSMAFWRMIYLLWQKIHIT